MVRKIGDKYQPGNAGQASVKEADVYAPPPKQELTPIPYLHLCPRCKKESEFGHLCPLCLHLVAMAAERKEDLSKVLRKYDDMPVDLT